MPNCEPLFCVYKGADFSARIKFFCDDAPLDLSGSALIARGFRRGFEKPVFVVAPTIVDEGTAELRLSKDITATLVPGVYALEVLRDSDDQGNGQRSALLFGLFKVFGV